MKEPEFVSWRVGRSWSKWHLSRRTDRTLCGANPAPGANWTRSGVPNEQLCTTCLEVLANEAAPREEVTNG